MAAAPITGLHLIRFGTAADQEYFLNDWLGTYDQIVVNANMVAHMPAALSTFLAFRTQKPYFVDPQTHAFQHEVEHLMSDAKDEAQKTKLKRSWQTLVNAYGSPIVNVVGGDNPRPLLPDDLNDAALRKKFCERVLLFQKDRISTEATTGENAEYVQFYAAEEQKNPGQFPPTLLIAPYFYLAYQFFDEWLEVNLHCLTASRAVVTEAKITEPLAAEIVIARETLSSPKRLNELIKAYSEHASQPDVFLLWIDSFVEQEASTDELRALVKLVDGLSATGKPVANLYGGYFSVASARFGALQGKLQGVCHGLEYGESKPVVPISGGVPVAKFYLPALHARLNTRVAVRTIRALKGFASPTEFFRVVCDCVECRNVIKGNPEKDFGAFTEAKASTFWRSGQRVAMEFPTAKASDLCAKHYLLCKHREYTEAKDLGALCAELGATFAVLKEPIGLEYAGHAAIWPVVLKNPQG
jgi:hypothetical protein